MLRVVNGARTLVFKGSWKQCWRWCSCWTWSCLHFKGAARSLFCAEYSISCISAHCVLLPYSEHVLRIVNGARNLVFKGSWKLRWYWCFRWKWRWLHFKGAARSLLCAEYSISCISAHCVFLPYNEHVLRVVNGARTLVFKGSGKLHGCWCSRWTWSCMHFKRASRSLLCAEYSISCISAHCVLLPYS